MVLYDGGDNIMNRDTLKQIMIDQKEIIITLYTVYIRKLAFVIFKI